MTALVQTLWVVRPWGKCARFVLTAPSLVWNFLDSYWLERVGVSKVPFTFRSDTPKRGVRNIPWITIPNLCCPVIIKRKIIKQGVNEAKLSDSLRVQETEYLEPDFIWE